MARRAKAAGEGGRVRDEFLDAIGRKVKLARVRANLTQKQVADALGTGPSWVFMIEDGQQNLQLSSLRRLAEVLGTGVRDLLPDEPDLGPRAELAKETDETIEKAIGQASEVLRALHKLQVLTGRHLLAPGTSTPTPAPDPSSSERKI